jgi:zinc/manganese transport system substrate-binding protein
MTCAGAARWRWGWAFAVAKRSRLAAVVAAAMLIAHPLQAQDAGRPGGSDKLNVVASFSILADLVRHVGGARVGVTALVGPGGDAHVYSPSPADAKILAAARLIVVNGLGFEGWMDRLVQVSAAKAEVVVASTGIAPRPAASLTDATSTADRIDPHAWQSIRNAEIYVANIRDGLIRADPTGRRIYEENAAAYLGELDHLDGEAKRAIAEISPARRKVITTHNAFAYFAAEYGVAFIAQQGVSTETEASARDVARIILLIRREGIPAIFFENVADPRLLKRIAAETGARIGGTLFSDSLTPANGPAPTYMRMMRHNIEAIIAALR